MARFDWKRFFTQHRVAYVTSGPNFSRRNVANIRCPWCGQNDPSEHMGVASSGVYGCLRNASHRGRTPVPLIRKLLGCSEDEAQRLVKGDTAQAASADDLDSSFAALRQRITGVAPAEDIPLKFPREFYPLLNGSSMAVQFIDYLHQRGYRDQQIEWLAENYTLQYATRGDFAWRLIIPIFDRYGHLLSWTGRGISKDATPRYKTLRMAGDPPLAKIPSNHTVLGLQVLYAVDNPRALVLVEGPFDALKLTAFGQQLGVYAASLFGLNVYREQVSEVLALASKFERVYLLIDEDAELQRLRLLAALKPLNVIPLKMPPGSDDPGAMSGAEAVNFCLKLVA